MHEVSALTCNESMHHDKSAHSFTCIEGAGNVHIAKRYAHANVNTERARSNVGMYDGRGTHRSNVITPVCTFIYARAGNVLYARAGNVLIAERRVHDERTRCYVGMHDRRARI
jgi:hypothetical protein